MTYLIGADEAGYGPNLGPLVISASLWRVPHGINHSQLYELLGHVISCESAGRAKGKIPIADSKRLYQPGGGLADLEFAVLASLLHLGRAATSWREIWRCLDPDSLADLADQPWHEEFDRALPHHAPIDELARLASTYSTGLANAGVKLLDLRSAIVFPRRFNQLVLKHGNKAAALSVTTLSLVAALAEPLGDEPIYILCDKHGGRNFYCALLQHVFPVFLAEVVRESRSESIYRWGPPNRRVEISFVAKGERFLPSALASMTCKYLRELSMLPFNEYWQRQVPGIKPTAGYPEDAARFKREIGAAQKRLGIDDELLWRCR